MIHPTRCQDSDESGQGLTEYLILLILVAVVSLTAARSLGGAIRQKIQLARDHIRKDVVLKSSDDSEG